MDAIGHLSDARPIDTAVAVQSCDAFPQSVDLVVDLWASSLSGVDTLEQEVIAVGRRPRSLPVEVPGMPLDGTQGRKELQQLLVELIAHFCTP
jgi:hypothetical protein